MGQKVNPLGFRLGIVKQHSSMWFAEGALYREQLLADVRVRNYLEKRLFHAQVSEVIIERRGNNHVKIKIHTARPGAVIGKKGEEIEQIKKDLLAVCSIAGTELTIDVDIEEVKKPDINARLIACSIARQLEKRVMFRRSLKKAVQNAMRQGAEGIRVQVSGRLGGADIARTEWLREGRVPLHTLRADVDYATERSNTTYGVIGVKVWIFKGELVDMEDEVQGNQTQEG